MIMAPDYQMTFHAASYGEVEVRLVEKATGKSRVLLCTKPYALRNLMAFAECMGIDTSQCDPYEFFEKINLDDDTP